MSDGDMDMNDDNDPFNGNIHNEIKLTHGINKNIYKGRNDFER